MIAPFWHDFDPSRGGNIYYRQTADPHVTQSFYMLLNNISSQENATVTNIVIATWDGVPPFTGLSPFTGIYVDSSQFNTLQVILAGDGISKSLLCSFPL